MIGITHTCSSLRGAVVPEMVGWGEAAAHPPLGCMGKGKSIPTTQPGSDLGGLGKG